MELHTRIKNKIDTLENWQSNNPILLKGEFAITITTISMNDAPAKAFLVKVGDGEKHYNDLPFVQAISSDIYEWAKQPTKPSYSAEEINGLAEFVKSLQSEEPLKYVWYDYGPLYDKVYWSSVSFVADYNYYIHNDSEYTLRVDYDIYNNTGTITLAPGEVSSQMHYIISVSHVINRVMRIDDTQN